MSARVADGEAIYTLDAERIRDIQPDLILAQDLCQVCAVPSGAVEEALEVLGCHADVISLDPSTLDEVIDCVAVVGEATGTEARARALVHELRARVDVVRRAVVQHHRPRTFALEWSDPPFSGGHWVPDMIEAAGGTPSSRRAGSTVAASHWDEVPTPPTRRGGVHAVRLRLRRSRRGGAPTARRAGARAGRAHLRRPMPTRCSPGPGRAWSTAWRRSPGRCTRGAHRAPPPGVDHRDSAGTRSAPTGSRSRR